MVVLVGVGGQPALRTKLTAVPCFVEATGPHRIRLKQLLNDFCARSVKVAGEIGLGQRRQIARTIDEELRVSDAEFLFELAQKRRCRLCAATLRRSSVEHDF